MSTEERAPTDRIERALARIERAAQARAFDMHRIASRHAALRARVEDAVEALDRLGVAKPAD